MVEPLAVMVKDMNTLVTDRAMLGPGATDGNVTKVTTTIFYDVAMLSFVKLWYGLLGVQGK